MPTIDQVAALLQPSRPTTWQRIADILAGGTSALSVPSRPGMSPWEGLAAGIGVGMQSSLANRLQRDNFQRQYGLALLKAYESEQEALRESELANARASMYNTLADRNVAVAGVQPSIAARNTAETALANARATAALNPPARPVIQRDTPQMQNWRYFGGLTPAEKENPLVQRLFFPAPPTPPRPAPQPTLANMAAATTLEYNTLVRQQAALDPADPEYATKYKTIDKQLSVLDKQLERISKSDKSLDPTPRPPTPQRPDHTGARIRRQELLDDAYGKLILEYGTDDADKLIAKSKEWLPKIADTSIRGSLVAYIRAKGRKAPNKREILPQSSAVPGKKEATVTKPQWQLDIDKALKGK